MEEKNARNQKNLKENGSPNHQQVPLMSTSTPKTPRKVRFNTDEDAQNHNGESGSIIQGEATRIIKAPRRLKVSIDKGLPNQNAASVSVVKREMAKKPTAEVSPQKANQSREEDLLSEPKTKKSKKDRLTNSERMKGLTVEERISTRSTQAKSDDNIPKVNESSATNNTVLPPKKPVAVHSGTARKSIGGKGKNASLQKEFYKNKEKNYEISKERFDKCDEQVLFKMMVDKFDAEKILQVYKEKRNQWYKKEMIQEAARIFYVNLENQSTVDNVAKLESLNKILKELPKLLDSNEEIDDMVLKAYGHHLKPDKVFELLDRNEIKVALLKNFTASEFVEMFKQTDNSSVIKQILEMASADAIVHEVKTRKNLETSHALLKASLEMETEVEAMSNSTVGLTDAIIEVINSKKILRTSEVLLNFMLKNVDDVVSKETKSNVIDFLSKKFSTEELMDLSHAAMKSSLHKNKNISVIDISD